MSYRRFATDDPDSFVPLPHPLPRNPSPSPPIHCARPARLLLRLLPLLSSICAPPPSPAKALPPLPLHLSVFTAFSSLYIAAASTFPSRRRFPRNAASPSSKQLFPSIVVPLRPSGSYTPSAISGLKGPNRPSLDRQDGCCRPAADEKIKKLHAAVAQLNQISRAPSLPRSALSG